MTMKNEEILREAILNLGADFLKQGRPLSHLKKIIRKNLPKERTEKSLPRSICPRKVLLVTLLLSLVCALFFSASSGISFLARSIRGTRCLLPSNYLVWEFTRPVSSCDFCRDVEGALILRNLTREEFAPYAYSPRPMVIRNAASHWQASKVFSLFFFRNLYEGIDGAYESVEEECQFLHFKSNFPSLRDVFSMSDRRALNRRGEDPWYVGWKNCHPEVLEVMRRFYEPPHFLPEDAEIPHTNYVFMGYEQGAVMHLDYIPRLMWQGQILGSKTWSVAPTPECDDRCKPFKFSVNAGDIVLLDTRIWYHGTHVDNGIKIVALSRSCNFDPHESYDIFNGSLETKRFREPPSARHRSGCTYSQMQSNSYGQIAIK